MRNTIDIIPNPNLKGTTCLFPQIPSLPPSTILKLTQSPTIIYTRYTPSPSPSPSPTAELPSTLCQLNNLKAGSMQLQPVYSLPQCRRLAVYVSRLDWQIVSNWASRLEEGIIDQVQVVWPGARIGVFYDRVNWVALRVQCQGVGLLGENSELEVLVEEEIKEEGQEEQKEREYDCEAVMVLPVAVLPSGNINKVYILRDHEMFTAAKTESLKQIEMSTKKSSKTHLKVPQTSPPTLPSSNPQPTPQRPPNETQTFQLHYTKANPDQDLKFPCDTNKMSIKEQIKYIAGMKSGGKGKGEGRKVERVLVEVGVVEDVDRVEMDCFRVYGRYMDSYRYPKPEPEPEPQPQPKQEQQPTFQTHNPDSPTIQIEPLHNNTILLPQSLISLLLIDTKQPLKLTTIAKNSNLNTSRNLDYLLNMKDFNVRVQVVDRDEGEGLGEELGGWVVGEIVGKVLGDCDKMSSEEDKGLEIKGNGLTVYGKMPYMMKDKSIKFAYITFHQGQKVISDPLTIFHSSPKKKPRGKQSKEREEPLEIEANQALKEKLMKAITVENLFYENQNEEEIRAKVVLLNKLENLGVRKGERAEKGMGSKTNEEIFIQLYKICYREQITKLLKLLPQPRKPFTKPSPSPIPPPILITSFSNNGKTVLNHILRQQGHKTLYLDMSQIDDQSLVLPSLTEYLELVFQLFGGPIIFMDNLDAICYRVEKGDLHRRQEKIAARILMRKITEFARLYNKLCVLTAKNEANIDEELTHYQLIKLKNPSREIRSQILSQYYDKNKEMESKDKIQEIIQNSESMSFGEFSKYVISGHKTESSSQKPSTLNFSKLAGIKEAKNTLRTIVERPLKYSFVFKKLPIKLSRGVLLYGGSGTGKSAIGQALAGEFKMKFFSVKGSDILSKYIGGSEASVRDIFEKAMTVSPSIVFFDEFQSIVPRRNASNTGVTDRVVNQFLCYLDGVASVQGVYIVAASSRPQLIDPALLRPGRIDTHIFLDHPTLEQREELFALYSNSIHFETPIEQLLKLTDQFSYSDLIGLIKELRIKQSARIIKESGSEEAVDAKKFKFIEDGFLREILSGFKVSQTKQEKAREREKYLAFKRGDAPDISKQKTILQ